MPAVAGQPNGQQIVYIRGTHSHPMPMQQQQPATASVGAVAQPSLDIGSADGKKAAVGNGENIKIFVILLLIYKN